MELDVKLPLPKCSEKDGSYKLEECNKHGYCQCISPITGEFLPGNGININCAGNACLAPNKNTNLNITSW